MLFSGRPRGQKSKIQVPGRVLWRPEVQSPRPLSAPVRLGPRALSCHADVRLLVTGASLCPSSRAFLCFPRAGPDDQALT